MALLQDHQFTPDVTRILRDMKATSQVQAVELMVASNTITVAHVAALLKATAPEQRADVPPPVRDSKTALCLGIHSVLSTDSRHIGAASV